MSKLNYAPPVDKLLTMGDCRDFRKWPDYLELGLNAEHIPDLIRMATDAKLNWADPASVEVWAPIHAWRALGQLRAAAAIEPLLNLFDEMIDSDWIDETMPRVFGLIGPAAIPALSAFMAGTKHDMYARIAASTCLEHIGNRHRAAKPACAAAVAAELEKFAGHDPTFNAFLISALIDLEASEFLPLINRVFMADRVDESVVGDRDDVRAEFGLTQPGQSSRQLLM